MDESDRAGRRDGVGQHLHDGDGTPDRPGAHFDPLLPRQSQDLSLRLDPRGQGAAVAAWSLVRYFDRRALGDEQGDRRFRAAGAGMNGTARQAMNVRPVVFTAAALMIAI